MIRIQNILLLLFLLSFLPVQILQAQQKAVVIPLMGKQNSLQGDLYYTIPFAQFEPAYETVDYSHDSFIIFSVPYGYLTLGTNTNYAAFTAPVILPDNAVISEISLSVSDVLDSATIDLYLVKQSLTSGTQQIIPDTTPLSSAAVATDTTDLISRSISSEVVDNQNFYYYVSALFQGSPSDQLRAARIKYNLP